MFVILHQFLAQISDAYFDSSKVIYMCERLDANSSEFIHRVIILHNHVCKANSLKEVRFNVQSVADKLSLLHYPLSFSKTKELDVPDYGSRHALSPSIFDSAAVQFQIIFLKLLKYE